jgi:hypothetical protein
MNTIRHHSVLILLLVLSMLAPEYALAKYRLPDLQEVPIKRLLSNLKDQIRQNPQDPWLRLNLARAYSMAFALNSDEAKITLNTHDGQLSFWHVPFEYSPQMPQSITNRPGKSAREYLLQAIELYEITLKTDSKDEHIAQYARLGHAWCLEQANNKKIAIEDYRILVRQIVPEKFASPDPSRKRSPGLDWSDASAEAAGYLIALLDPKQDAAEISTLQEQLKQFARRPRAITPIAIPLKANTSLADIEDRNARVTFDIDGRNVGQNWSWITPKAGWLAYDPKKNGKISSGIQLFGNVSYWMFWKNGYQALSVLDDNGDGILTGQELNGLVIWIDENRNGVYDPGEIKTLSELNIQGLRYNHITLNGHQDHIVFSPQGVQFSDGSNAPSYDIILHKRP